MSQPIVSILMGSQSDWSVMEHASLTLNELGIAHECKITSAHRTPDRHHAYVTGAAERGIKLFICGAGMAAHLAGMTAALTHLPVFGVPLAGGAMDGLDSLLSTVQMPGGIPVATFAIGKAGAKNAAVMAAQTLAMSDPKMAEKVKAFRAAQTAAVPEEPTGWQKGAAA
ncbi:MAG: 5-(carboxyamino)imidazole ribonucleotide mutase [Proteobacteria bacterium]|nr:5-(carboxyamino)imidazole ribonucleotide mutase [Pseudomonadota bacterium]